MRVSSSPVDRKVARLLARRAHPRLASQESLQAIARRRLGVVRASKKN